MNMKKLLLPLCFLFSFYGAQAQLQTDNRLINFGSNTYSKTAPLSKGVATCSNDTVEYTLAKATGLQALNINNATSAQAISQYFNAPQSITVHGTSFFAYKLDATGGLTLDATVELYLAGPDSMPTGAALATETVVVDTVFGGGDLAVLEKNISFSSPITVNQPYVIVVGNYSANGMGMIFNNWSAVPGDGAQEWLAGVDLFGSWTRPYNVNVGGVPFDADALIYPHVSYDLTADFIASDTIFSSNPDTISFTDNSSPILQDRMYNQAAFIGVTELSYTYDFGDGSSVVNAIDTNHIFAATQSYSVTLSDTIYGWRTNCRAEETKTIAMPPVANLVITEIMYNPPEAGTDQLEFIEIYNNGATAVDLTNYTCTGGTYTFPNVSLPAGAFYVIAVNPFEFDSLFEFMPNGQFTGGLSNAGEAIVLKNAVGQIIDSVYYDDSAPWPIGSSFGAPDGGGSSLILCDVNSDNNDGSNWTVETTYAGHYIFGTYADDDVFASPGVANFCCPVLTGVDTQSACDSLVWVDGSTYYSDNNTATFTYVNGAGCDSVVTLDLTINASPNIIVTEPAFTMQSANCFGTEFIIHASGADTYVWDDLSTDTIYTYVADTANMWFTLSVTGTDTITGCSSVGTFYIPGVYDPVAPGSQTLTICNGQSITVGSNTYISTGIYTDTIMSTVSPCDSIVTTNLTVEAAIDVTIDNTLTPTLTANQTGATYQWLDCDNGNIIVIGADSQSFTPTVGGFYAVEITIGSCIDTSACENVFVDGVKETTNNVVSIYPNPTNGLFTISLANVKGAISYTITTLEGRIVEQAKSVTKNNIEVDLTNESKGVYFLMIQENNLNTTYKIIRQ
jgi:hypothetical protein